MDAETKTVLEKQGQYINSLAIQNTVLACALEAVIATHDDRKRAKIFFDQLFGQIQASQIWLDAPDDDRVQARAMAAKLFSDIH